MSRKQEAMAAKQSERRQEVEEKRGQAKQRRKKAYSRVCLPFLLSLGRNHG